MRSHARDRETAPIDHLIVMQYNDDSQTGNDRVVKSRACESLPGMNTSYYPILFYTFTPSASLARDTRSIIR